MGSKSTRIDRKERLNEMKHYTSIVKEGILYKQSKYLKDWRERKILLNSFKIVTFPTSRRINLPCTCSDDFNDQLSTLQIKLKDITHLRRYENKQHYYIEITTTNQEMRLRTTNKQECDQWYTAIKAYRSSRGKGKCLVRASTTRQNEWNRFITNNEI